MKLIVLILGLALIFASPITSFANDDYGTGSEVADDLDQPIEEDDISSPVIDEPVAEAPKVEEKKPVKKPKKVVRKAKKKPKKLQKDI